MKLSTAALLVQELVTLADVHAAHVVVVHTEIVAAVPVSHLGHCGHVAPVAHVSHCSPCSHCGH